MPLVTVKLKKGKVYEMQLIHGVDYEKLADNFERNATTSSKTFSKMELKNC